MLPGVAATRSKELHFTNWLNWNCESLVWVGGLSPASRGAKWAQREFARCTAGICEFHHEQHVHDIRRFPHLEVFEISSVPTRMCCKGFFITVFPERLKSS